MKLSSAFIFVVSAFLLIVGCKDESQKLDIPEFYTFSRDQSNSVDFRHQTYRINTAEFLISSMLDFTKTDTELLNLFGKIDLENPPTMINGFSANIRGKVAASNDYFSQNTVRSASIRSQFDSWISKQVGEIGVAENELAAIGKAGQIADVGKVRYVNAKGIEFNQVFAKSLIGGLMLDQIVNHYLSPAVLDAGQNRVNNDEKNNDLGKFHTNMEHKWDEAYGYIFGASPSSSDPLASVGEDDSFLNEYTGKVDQDPDFRGIAEDIFDAFKKGRAAIVASDYELRDEQAEILREKLSIVIGVRAVYYLQQGKRAILNENYGSGFHSLSEAYGFIYSLQFTREPNTSVSYFSQEQIELFTSQLSAGNGFWDVKAETLDQISEEVASAFNFTVAQAAE